jgi:hypothetical protein
VPKGRFTAGQDRPSLSLVGGLSDFGQVVAFATKRIEREPTPEEIHRASERIERLKDRERLRQQQNPV